jgi:hypothetical protein
VVILPSLPSSPPHILVYYSYDFGKGKRKLLGEKEEKRCHEIMFGFVFVFLFPLPFFGFRLPTKAGFSVPLFLSMGRETQKRELFLVQTGGFFYLSYSLAGKLTDKFKEINF